MNQTTINLLAHVLPPQPLRQWVLTVPYELRAPLGYEPGLMSAVVRGFADSLLRWYARRLAPAAARAQGGLFTVIQRCSGDLRLSPHLHVVALDGCYTAGSDGKPVFHPLPHLKSDEVADVLQIAKTRILEALARLGAVEVLPDALAVDEAWAARDPVMASLAAAAVAGLPPAGPAERRREPVTIVDGGRPAIVGDLVVQDRGFNLHAKTRAGALDEPARARLLRYVLRPPLARERLERLPDHRVRLRLKRPWSDGTYALALNALALLSRLARPRCRRPGSTWSSTQGCSPPIRAGGRSSSPHQRSRARLPLPPSTAPPRKRRLSPAPLALALAGVAATSAGQSSCA